MAKSSSGPPASKSSTHHADCRIPQAAARPIVRRVARIRAPVAVGRARCSRRPAAIAARKRACHSSRAVTNRCTAAPASNRCEARAASRPSVARLRLAQYPYGFAIVYVVARMPERARAPRLLVAVVVDVRVSRGARARHGRRLRCGRRRATACRFGRCRRRASAAVARAGRQDQSEQTRRDERAHVPHTQARPRWMPRPILSG